MRCFVIMPFGNPSVDAKKAEEFDYIYNHCIKKTVESIESPQPGSFLNCQRADTDHRPSDIISHILDQLATSEIVVADLTDRNANVFYELGVRHAISNNTILISQQICDIPFDLRTQRVIEYKYDPRSLANLNESLIKAIKSILESPNAIDNPVRKFLYERERDKIIASQTPPGFDMVKETLAEMKLLKTEFSNQLQNLRQVIEQVTDRNGSSETNQLTCSGMIDLEGMWKSSSSGSLACIRCINGKLFMPYCYGSETHLTGHYFDVRQIEDGFFAKYKWFNEPIDGYAYYRLASRDRLVGGWWYSDRVPSDITQHLAAIREATLPGMMPAEFVRVGTIDDFPEWANEYFRKIEQDSAQH